MNHRSILRTFQYLYYFDKTTSHHILTYPRVPIYSFKTLEIFVAKTELGPKFVVFTFTFFSSNLIKQWGAAAPLLLPLVFGTRPPPSPSKGNLPTAITGATLLNRTTTVYRGRCAILSHIDFWFNLCWILLFTAFQFELSYNSPGSTRNSFCFRFLSFSLVCPRLIRIKMSKWSKIKQIWSKYVAKRGI